MHSKFDVINNCGPVGSTPSNKLEKCLSRLLGKMTAVGFEPTQLALVELESTPLDHSGKLSLVHM